MDAGPAIGVAASSVTLIGGLDPSGVMVTLQGSGLVLQTSTDADGGYAFTGLPSGQYDLSFQKAVLLPADAGYAAGADGGPPSLDYQATIPELLVQEDGGAFIVDLDGGQFPLASIELTAGSQLLVSPSSDVLISPDGTHLAVLANMNAVGEGTLEVEAVTGGAPVQLGRAQSLFFGYFGFSPDGSQMAYLNGTAQGTQLVLVPVAGGPPVTLGTNVGISSAGQGLFSFSPDGTQVAFLTNTNSSVGTLELAASSGNGAPVQLGTGVSSWAFSPDSRWVAFKTTGPTTNTLYLASVSGGTPTQIATGQEIDSFVFSPDSRLAYDQSLPDASYTLNLAPVSDGGPIVLSQQSGHFGWFQFTPDGSRVVFLANTAQLSSNPFSLAGTLEVAVTDDGGPPTQIANDVAAYNGAQPQLSPDGSQVAFFTGYDDTTGNAAAELAALAGGTPTQLVAQAIMQGMQFSPDGSHLGFVAVNGSGSTATTILETMAVPGGTPVAIMSNVSAYWQFSPDGTHVEFDVSTPPAYLNTLQVAAVSGGSPVEIADRVYWSGFSGNALVSVREQTPTPFDFLSGVDVTPLP
jgi:Tol biopolymer transport system component